MPVPPIRRITMAASALAVVAQAQEPLRTDWFETGTLPELRIELGPKAAEMLRRKPREYVKAKLRENGAKGFDVAIKLKGSAGSFRPLRKKPGLTIDVNRFDRKRAFHGLVKFHLNNAVQDRTYLQEYLAYEVFRMVGLPAPRVTHARVWIDGRDVGLYVLKEGYDRRFLARSFADATGNLYDGGVNGDVDDDLDRDEGRGPLDRRDLKALAAACALPAGPQRRKRLAETLDIDRFLTFMAAEVMICHWDGYTLNPNNYRLYFPGKSRRGVFLIHGADQVFQNPRAGLFKRPKGRVAKCVLAEPVWRDAYRDRVRSLLKVFVPPTALVDRLRHKAARLRPLVERTMPPRFARKLAERQKQLLERVAKRARFLARASRGDWPKVLEVTRKGNALADRHWQAKTDCKDVVMSGNDGKPGTPFSIRAGGCGQCVGSWRTTVLLNRGKYELQAVMTTKDVVVGKEKYNPGAGIRISGGRRRWVASGSAVDKAVVFPFEVGRDGDSVVLVIDLRASAGSVSFRKGSLRLRRR